MPKPLNLIVACAENRVMGRDGRLPWRISEDFRLFERATAGKICVQGRVCFQSWTRAAMDGRRPVVVTRQNELVRAGVRVAASFPAALAIAEILLGEIYVCGGQRIFEEALALAGTRVLRLHLTLIHAEVAGDTFFPEWRHLAWRELARRESADANFRYTFFTLEVFAPQQP